MTSSDCRLCGTSDSEINIFERNSEAVSLEFIIRTRLQITITKSDEFSQVICVPCARQLKQVYAFSKECQQNQIRLSVIATEDKDKQNFQKNNYDMEYSHNDMLKNTTVECRSITSSLQSINNIKTSRIKITAANCDNIIIPDLTFDDEEINTVNESEFDEVVPVKNEKIPFSKIVNYFNTRIKWKSNSTHSKAVHEGISASDSDPMITLKKYNSLLEREKATSIPKVFDLQFVEKGYMSDDSTFGERKYNIRKKRTLRNKDDIKCPYCGWLFPKEELENDHIHIHTSDAELHKQVMELYYNKTKLDVPTVECPDCNEIFLEDILYTEHRNMHEQRKPIKCHVCDHFFISRKRLKAHMCTVHLERIFKCDECSYRAKNAADIHKHKLGVHSGQRIMCPLCGKLIAAYPHNMKKHMDTHSEVPSYKCEMCPSAYRTKASLGKHRENKHFPVSVMCSVCGMVCASKQKYKKHIAKCKKRNAVDK